MRLATAQEQELAALREELERVRAKRKRSGGAKTFSRGRKKPRKG